MNNTAVVSLRNSCFLTILSEIQNYSADTISFLPTRLRASLLLHVPAVDLYRFASHDGVWIGLPFDSEDVWKFRYETTLKKFVNVSCLEPGVEGISWQERYLVSCLINVPEHYDRTSATFGVAFFVTSDIALKDVGIVKLKSGFCCYGFMSLQFMINDGSNTTSPHLISRHYQQELNSYPFNIPVGADLSTYNRIKTMLVLFSDWKPAMIPLEYDDYLEEKYDESICTSFVSNVKAVQLLSKHLRSYPYAEVKSHTIDVSSQPQESIGQFCNYMIDLIKNRKSGEYLNRLIVSPPAMKKEVKVKYRELSTFDDLAMYYDDHEVTLTPLSFSTSEVLEWFFQHFPNVSELVVHMHSSHQDCWTSSFFHQAKLKNLQLNVVCPTFNCLSAAIPTTLASSISEISLSGLVMSDEDFTCLLLSVLNSPNEQQLKLSNINVRPKKHHIVSQEMKSECRYKTSFYFSLIQDDGTIYSVFEAYEEVWLNKLSIFFSGHLDQTLPFPVTTVINCKSVHLERFELSQDNLYILSPVLSKAEKVYFSPSEFYYYTADFAISKICQCIQLCKRNLYYLEFRKNMRNAYVGLNIRHLYQFFSAVFSLPSSTLVNLIFNPSFLINKVRRKAEVDELKHCISGYRFLCQVWKRKNYDFKIKCLCGISEAIVNEMEDELLECCETVKSQYMHDSF